LGDLGGPKPPVGETQKKNAGGPPNGKRGKGKNSEKKNWEKKGIVGNTPARKMAGTRTPKLGPGGPPKWGPPNEWKLEMDGTEPCGNGGVGLRLEKKSHKK